MTVTITFQDSENVYTVDFLMIAKQLGITESDVRKAVTDAIRSS